MIKDSKNRTEGTLTAVQIGSLPVLLTVPDRAESVKSVSDMNWTVWDRCLAGFEQIKLVSDEPMEPVPGRNKPMEPDPYKIRGTAVVSSAWFFSQSIKLMPYSTGTNDEVNSYSED